MREPLKYESKDQAMQQTVKIANAHEGTFASNSLSKFLALSLLPLRHSVAPPRIKLPLCS